MFVAGKGGTHDHPQNPGPWRKRPAPSPGRLRTRRRRALVHAGLLPTRPPGVLWAPQPACAAHVCECERLCARPGRRGYLGGEGVSVCTSVCVRSRIHQLIISNSNDFQRGSEGIAQSGDSGGLRLALQTQPRLYGLCSHPQDSAGALRGSRRR